MRAAARWVLPAVLALGVAVALLTAVGAPPFDALRLVAEGAFGGTQRAADTVMAWVPLALAGAGLVVTFTAGLWNIGVEGQVIAGAIAATLAARTVPGPTPAVVTAALGAALLGGMAWGMAAGALRTWGGVNEIFGGLGLGFVAQAFATYLVIGPWKRAGIASTSGTDVFRDEAWLPTVGTTRLSLVAVGVAATALVAVALVLRGTRFGLRLKAVGRNPASALLLGVPTRATMMRAFSIGGGLAGMAGGVLAVGFQHKLVPAIAGGRGFLAVLVVLLAGFRAAWVGPLALFFAAISVGSAQLQLRLDLDSALGGVLQGVLVLFAVLAGSRALFAAREERG
jgi:simple sugar transport system permease protein